MSKLRATLAQLVEHLIRNERVAGSIPAGGSSFQFHALKARVMRVLVFLHVG
jgi:hypothetical protein